MHRILVGVDGSRHATFAVRLGAELCVRFSAELWLLHVLQKSTLPLDFYPSGARDLRRQAENEAARLLDDAERIAASEGMPGCHPVVGTGPAAAEILRVAAEQRCDLVVVGRRGTGGKGRLYLGSVSQAVVDRCRCSVLIARRTDLEPG